MSPSSEGRELIRSEEELDVDTRQREAGRVRARKIVDHEQVEQNVPAAPGTPVEDTTSP